MIITVIIIIIIISSSSRRPDAAGDNHARREVHLAALRSAVQHVQADLLVGGARQLVDADAPLLKPLRAVHVRLEGVAEEVPGELRVPQK